MIKMNKWGGFCHSCWHFSFFSASNERLWLVVKNDTLSTTSSLDIFFPPHLIQYFWTVENQYEHLLSKLKVCESKHKSQYSSNHTVNVHRAAKQGSSISVPLKEKSSTKYSDIQSEALIWDSSRLLSLTLKIRYREIKPLPLACANTLVKVVIKALSGDLP